MFDSLKIGDKTSYGNCENASLPSFFVCVCVCLCRHFYLWCKACGTCRQLRCKGVKLTWENVRVKRSGWKPSSGWKRLEKSDFLFICKHSLRRDSIFDFGFIGVFVFVFANVKFQRHCHNKTWISSHVPHSWSWFVPFFIFTSSDLCTFYCVHFAIFHAVRRIFQSISIKSDHFYLFGDACWLVINLNGKILHFIKIDTFFSALVLFQRNQSNILQIVCASHQHLRKKKFRTTASNAWQVRCARIGN